MHNYIIPHHYDPKTLIGNWSEERDLSLQSNMDYHKHKQTSSLQSISKDLILQQSKQLSYLSSSPDGFLHFGMRLQLSNTKTNSVLSCDLHETLSQEIFSVTTSPSKAVSLRNVFIIDRYEKDLFEDEILHYG